MNFSILLITGWGGGTQLLHPLQQALENHAHRVEVINIFDAFDAAVLQQNVALARDYDVIVGWSLGGQLAAVLVNEIEKKYAEHKILITLALILVLWRMIFGRMPCRLQPLKPLNSHLSMMRSAR